MTDARALYGTDAPIAPSERVIVGKLSFTLENGALRHIRWIARFPSSAQ